MCLYSKIGIPQVTEVPITCYKILKIRDDSHAYSFFQDYDYGDVSDIEGKTFWAEEVPFFQNIYEEVNGISIYGAYIHAFTTPEDLLRSFEIEQATRIPGIKILICKCEIPAGTTGFYGSDDKGYLDDADSPDDLHLSYFPKQYINRFRMSFAVKGIKFIKTKSFVGEGVTDIVPHIKKWLTEINNG